MPMCKMFFFRPGKRLRELEEKLKESEEAVARLREAVPKKVEAVVSTEALEDVVNRMMREDGLNVALLPDWLERRLYMNVLKLGLTALNACLGGVACDVFGHRITLHLERK